MATCILRPIGVIGMVVTTLVAPTDASVGAPANTAVAKDCLSAPNSPAPAGEHWYYHIDRAGQRKCWYLRNQSARLPDGQPTSEVAPAIHSAFTKPSARSASATPPRADGAAVLPHVTTPAPQFAPKIRPKTSSSISAGSPSASPLPTPAPSTLQAESPIVTPSDAQRGTGAPGSINAGRTGAPPFPRPAVSTVQVGSPIAAPRSARGDNGKALRSRNLESSGRKNGPTITSKIAKLPGTRNFLTLVLVLGLIAGVGGDLWHIVRKVLSIQQPSLTSPVTADDQPPSTANETHGDFTSASEVLKRNHALARVSQQIDLLLGTPGFDEDRRQQRWDNDRQQSLINPVTCSANEKRGAVTSASEALKRDDALARLSQQIDPLIEMPTVQENQREFHEDQLPSFTEPVTGANEKQIAFKSNGEAIKCDGALQIDPLLAAPSVHENQLQHEFYEDKQQRFMHPVVADDKSPASANDKQVAFKTNSELKRCDALARLSQQIDGLLGTPRIDEDRRQEEYYKQQQQSLTDPNTASDDWPVVANERYGAGAFTKNGKMLKPDDALARLSQEMDWLLQKPRIA